MGGTHTGVIPVLRELGFLGLYKVSMCVCVYVYVHVYMCVMNICCVCTYMCTFIICFSIYAIRTFSSQYLC